MIPFLKRYDPPASASPPRAVVLVAHGLNLHPERMDPLCRLLAASGAAVLRIALYGHRGDYRQLEHLSRHSWIEDYREALRPVVSSRHGNRGREEVTIAGELSVGAGTGTSGRVLPAGFVGQSLGALTFCDYLLTDGTGQDDRGGGPPFRRALFLAPALALRPVAILPRPLSRLSRRLPIPSASSPQDRLYPRLPAGTYRALYDAHRTVRKKLHKTPLPLPSTIVLHPRDELISPRGISRLISRGSLPHSRLVLLAPDETARGTAHLGVDPETMGTANWQTVSDLAARFVDALAESHTSA